MKVAIVGATGLIGRRLIPALLGRGDRVVAVSRSGRDVEGAPGLAWDPADGPPPAALLEGTDAVVNMAGRPVLPARWTESAKREMRSSRVVTTRRLAEALAAGPPRVLVNASAVGFYGPLEEPVTESDGPGDNFLADLCLEWEDATRAAADAGSRVVLLRTAGMVLDADGGALPPLVRATKLFVGGPLAGGRFWLTWIHVADEIGIILRALDDPSIRGPVNATAPNPVRQKTFAATLGRVLSRPAVVPTPAFAMRLLFGEGAMAVITGQPAVPAALQEAGYTFAFPELEPALRDLLDRPLS
jgi:uncharacterized protein (TIGR01777 family)